jgi:signal transduction histidine kinase
MSAPSARPGPLRADENVMDELKRYVGFVPADAERLARVRPFLAPSFSRIVDDFYEAIERHPRARATFKDGHTQIERQKPRLLEWLHGVFSGVYDDAYFELRARIARAHVKFDVDQCYVVGSMNVVRGGLLRALHATDLEPNEKLLGQISIARICDIELAIMLETYRERYVERERTSARLAAIGQVAASIGHELRAPLAMIESSLGLVHCRIDDEKSAKHVEKISKQITISRSIIDGLIGLACEEPPECEPVRIDELIAESLAFVPTLEHIVVDVVIEPGLAPVRLDRGQMRQVLANLVANAAQAIGGDRGAGRIEIAAGVASDRAWIEVRDDGPGFPTGVLDRAFEPLVTSRATGTGLGLALCARIVEHHGGTVEARNHVDRGATVRVVFPPANTAA